VKRILKLNRFFGDVVTDIGGLDFLTHGVCLHIGLRH